MMADGSASSTHVGGPIHRLHTSSHASDFLGVPSSSGQPAIVTSRSATSGTPSASLAVVVDPHGLFLHRYSPGSLRYSPSSLQLSPSTLRYSPGSLLYSPVSLWYSPSLITSAYLWPGPCPLHYSPMARRCRPWSLPLHDPCPPCCLLSSSSVRGG